ncbi:MAG: ring-cleaving dioxygenase [Armatimonadetes bacterium]|nr:ring-cleaving dioxygenase [Armatimonadota bacterium]
MITGIHHVTAIAGDPQTNVNFYAGTLGLRLVKQTINYDDPGTYHLYYGDGLGRPGTILTFFPWKNARRGRAGTGQVVATALSIPVGAADFWRERLTTKGVAFDDHGTTLSFTDGDGLPLLLTEVAGDTRPGDNGAADVPGQYAIRGVDSVTLQVGTASPTLELLTGQMGFDISTDGDGRFTVGADTSGNAVYLHEAEEGDAPGLSGAGTVHHVAFRVPDDAAQATWQAELTTAGYHVSPVMDRQYFHSIYYREPGGVLFEIATDPPGFVADGETPETLGKRLQLPDWLEGKRDAIEAHLPKLTLP